MRAKRAMALLLCLVVLVGMVPLAGLMVSAEQDIYVTRLDFANDDYYYLSTVSSTYAVGTKYTVSFNYYYVPGTVEADLGKGEILTICNAGSSTWLWTPATDANGNDISGDALLWENQHKLHSSYAGFKKNQEAYVTFTVTLGENETFKPTLYTYGSCTLYIWNYDIRVNGTAITPAGQTQKANCPDITRNLSMKSQSAIWSDYGKYLKDQPVIKAEFEAGGTWWLYNGTQEPFNIPSSEWYSYGNTEYTIVFDYYLDSTMPISTRTASGSESLNYISGMQNYVSGSDQLEINQVAEFRQTMKSWGDGSTRGPVCRPGFTSSVKATLYI